MARLVARLPMPPLRPRTAAAGLATVVALAGCAVATPGGDAPRQVTIEHAAAAAPDEVAARAMQACRQAGKANAAFETMVDKRRDLAPGTGAQLSTYRCTP